MIDEIYRQGDLLIRKIEKFPMDKGRMRHKKDNIILEGEATGHAHRLVDGTLYTDWGVGNAGMYIDVPLRGEIVHEEHGTIELRKGLYEIVRQREYLKEGATGFVID